MNHPLSRRGLLGTTSRMAIASAAVAMLAACGATGTIPTIPVNLTSAQQQASATLTAAEEIAKEMPTVPASVISGLTNLGVAVSALTAIQPGQTYVNAALAFVKAASPLLSLLPISGPTLIALQAGIGLVSALAAGQAAVAAPAPTAAPALGATPVKIIPAPIPIPVPVS